MKVLSRLRNSPYAFALAALAAVAMFFISESFYRHTSQTFEELGTQGTARTMIQTLWRSLIDAETGQRGYLLTARDEYLRPYNAAQAETTQALDWLDNYYRNDPHTDALMRRVDQASRAKLSELSETLKLYDKDKGRGDGWRSLLSSNIGQEQMDSVRSLSSQLLALETERVVKARRSVAQTLMLNRIGVSAMTAISLLALFMYLRQTSALGVQREEQRRLVQLERDHLEREVARRTDQLTELARHLQTAREDERTRLARELHDELGALLTAAKLDVARLKSRLGATAPEVADRLQHLNEALNSGIALKRRIIEDLRPSSLSNLGLVAALDILVTEWSRRTETVVERQLEHVLLRPSGELTVYRLVQEALTNVSKYAKATHVAITLQSSEGVVTISVCDDGEGFDVDSPRTSAHGLLGMRYRVESEGGRMTLRSTLGNGTCIEAQMPESRTAITTDNDTDKEQFA